MRFTAKNRDFGPLRSPKCSSLDLICAGEKLQSRVYDVTADSIDRKADLHKTKILMIERQTES